MCDAHIVPSCEHQAAASPAASSPPDQSCTHAQWTCVDQRLRYGNWHRQHVFDLKMEFLANPSCLLALLGFGFEFTHGSFEECNREDSALSVLMQLPDVSHPQKNDRQLHSQTTHGDMQTARQTGRGKDKVNEKWKLCDIDELTVNVDCPPQDGF